jgi:large conductance mechanosensitive channel
MAEDIEIIPDAIERPGRVILAAPKRAFGGFLDFVRERGVMGLAIGFVLGSAVQKVVTAFVNDIVNPFVGLLLGRADGIKTFAIGNFLIGDFIAVLIDFLILAFIIYLVFRLLGLEKLDKPKA